ncbi:lyase family protein [Bradyrhizobium elkanii]|uniref:lyase family protein n=2 Tax=Nitrobacteraceae TaxID=41294 RepID=UPI002711E541|nr:lyase family protein [Bradyrhizobium elkanii]WLA41897.1 lyase family protein [Bradyrhizobium elkanii]
MNTNEVIANRALESMGLPRGRYDVVHPNNDVNLSQSTNDVCRQHTSRRDVV